MRNHLPVVTASLGAVLAAGGLVMALQPPTVVPGLALATLGAVLIVFAPTLSKA